MEEIIDLLQRPVLNIYAGIPFLRNTTVSAKAHIHPQGVCVLQVGVVICSVVLPPLRQGEQIPVFLTEHESAGFAGVLKSLDGFFKCWIHNSVFRLGVS